ncbi:MAG: cation diffusion facilitator family transporter [Bacteroides sp.]|jgi:cobalt-zinc-cadmium efflux system protein|nr:cation diffusion facilitator family transporter [Bacteroides sp.]MCI1684069.1 cation diffusion facilitator family transporter [Bacteroides sp.]
MPQEHHHTHTIDSNALNRAFIVGIILNLLFVFVEFSAGFWYNSLALLSDAGHNLGDVVSLVLALLAFRLAKVKANAKYTYGYKKSTILVSLFNAIILLLAVGAIIIESVQKLAHPEAVQGSAIAWVAGIGVIINAVTAFLFMKDKEKDLNVKGAYLHMAADALVSIGVLVAGIIINKTGWYIIDPIIGIVVAIIILFSTGHLLHDSLRLTLDGVPANIDSEKVSQAISSISGVYSLHHLHIWAISTTENALTAHIVLKSPAEMEEVKHHIRHRLEEFGIGHATLEFETPGEHCEAKCNCETNCIKS